MTLTIGQRIALLLAGVLLLAALALGTATIRSVGASMQEAAEASATNTLGLVVQNIDDEYGNLVAHREFTLDGRREQMRNVSASVIEALDHFHEMHESGAASEEAAQRAALDYLEDLRYGNDDYFYTYDVDMNAIAHPDPTIMGRDMSEIRDAMGKPVGRELQETALEQGAGFVSYWWKRLQTDEPSPKLGYVFHYRPWNWIIGTGVYIDDVEREADRELAAIKDRLADTFGAVSIADTGFVFVIDGGSDEVVITPRGRDLASLSAGTPGSDLLAVLGEGSQQTDGDFVLQREEAVGGSEPQVWTFRVRHFEPLGWHVVSAVPQAEIDAPGRRLATNQALVILGVLALSFLLASVMVRRATRPLATLTTYAEALPDQDFTLSADAVAVIEGITRRYRDEVGRLAGSFLAMERALQQYIVDLRETTAANERIESELRIARGIQMGILPKSFPAFPDRDELDLYATLEPAREVGGDLYDFFFVDDDTLCFLIGDVSGKGVPAALFMTATSTLVRGVAKEIRDPGEILVKVNDDLSQENESRMFVSLFVCLLDVRTGGVRYASAGHNPPLVEPRHGAATLVPLSGEPVAGPLPGASYTTHRLTLRAGDTMLLYTDGVTEAMNLRGELFGTDRLVDQLEQASAEPARDLVTAISAAVARFSGGAAQTDDIAVLAVRFRGPGGGPRVDVDDVLRLRLAADAKHLDRFRAFIVRKLEQWLVPEALTRRVELVLEEALVNVSTYAYPDGHGDVEVACSIGDAGGARQVCLSVLDWGQPFDPQTATSPDLGAGVTERPIGGLGIVLIRDLVDEVRYTREGDTNRLELLFDVPSS